jgi:hypothetical protein
MIATTITPTFQRFSMAQDTQSLLLVSRWAESKGID